MKEQELIKSFDKLGEIFDEQREKEIKNIFERALKGKFHKVSPGNFKSKIPEIESIIITPAISDKGRQSVNATVKYLGENNKPRNAMFSIFEDGLISGRMPHDLSISREALSLEILKAIEHINFNFWRQTDFDILPDFDEANHAKIMERENKELGEEKTDEPLDIERLKFLEQQSYAICGFVNKKNGFRGYHGVVFPNFILLEHPRRNNAAYLVDIKRPVEVDEDIFRRPADERVDEKTYEKILADTWKPISDKAKSRGELRREFNAQRVIHTPNTWKQRLQEAIDSHLKTNKVIS